MPFGNYDPKTTAILHAVFDGIWSELRCPHTSAASPSVAAATTVNLTRALLHAADTGERDPARLRAIALKEMEGA